MGRAEDIFEKIIKDGEIAINEFILARKSEELFLDFKRSADNGSGSKLNDIDREHLAKAISGFGNSEGGVIVWGIDCSKDKDHADVAHTKYPVQNVKRFVSWLEGVVFGCTVPPHTKVQHHYIVLENKDDGFVATLIPKSDHAPHQIAVHGKLQYQYYIRAGSNFERTPHAVLAGMFGRRPQPHVFHNFVIGPADLLDEKVKIQVGFMIRNQGPGIASDLFINALVISIPGDNCKVWFEIVDQNNWMGQFAFERQISVISKLDVRLAPESFVQPFVMTLYLVPPFTEKLIIDGICGCGQSPSYKFRLENDSSTIDKLYNDFFDESKKGLLDMDKRHDLVANVLNITT
ncbi:MAG: ATP-binding protein [Thermodesulfovibrionia bacterium]|nr:ATP-binding protein [Thermodesulfovibrionia bacterium]